MQLRKIYFAFFSPQENINIININWHPKFISRHPSSCMQVWPKNFWESKPYPGTHPEQNACFRAKARRVFQQPADEGKLSNFFPLDLRI